MQKSLNIPGIGICAGLLVLFGIIIHHHAPGTPTAPRAAKPIGTLSSKAADAYGHLPLSFERNQGQVNKQVTFLSHGPGYSLFLTANQAVLSLHTSGFGVLKTGDRGSGIGDRGHSVTRSIHFDHSSRIVNDPHKHLTNPEPRTPNTDAILRMRLVGANSHPQVTGVEELPGRVNYFIGNDRRKWRTQVPTFSRVQYKQVYPGIDMVYYGNQQQLEYDWVVAPGADVHQIQLGVTGAEKATLTAAGDLKLQTACGDVIQHAPITYQEIDGVRKPVSSHLALLASSSGTMERRIGFEVAAYDHTRPLIIDPVLVYATYLGGSEYTESFGIAVNSVGNAYITGFTIGDTLPVEVPYQPVNNSGSGYNVFISALNSSGTALLYSTYLGGSDQDQASAIAVDSAGNAYVTGYTHSPDFPTANAFQSTNHSKSTAVGNAFVTKINATGSALVYSTYLGGSSGDSGAAIAVDSSDNAYVSGSTFSTDFPTKNPYQASNHSPVYGNGFVTKFNATGSALIYSTYLGGTGTVNSLDADYCTGIAVDASGNAYVTGSTHSTNFPVTANVFQSTNHNSLWGNAFVTKINPTGSALVYSTYLGGSSGSNPGDMGNGIALDSAGDAYVTGYATSTNFPTAGTFQIQHTALNNGFLTKMNPTGSALIYSTYLGGQGNAVAVDSGGNAYVTGAFSAPLVNPIQQTGTSCVLEMNSVGSALLYSTDLVCNGGDGIAVDSYGAAYVTGTTDVDFPVQSPLQASNANGAENAFIARIGNYNQQTVDLTVGVDNFTRLLWNSTNFTAQVWNINNSGQTWAANSFGPVTGYTVTAISAGPDGLTRVLWNNTSGEAGLSFLTASNAYDTEYYYTIPATDWNVVDIAVGADNYTRLLWTHSDGTVAVASAANASSYFNLVNFGPYTGWTASRIATGSDGLTRLLWTKRDGSVAIWILNANNTYKSGFTLGPFTSWRGIDIAVGADNKTRLLWTSANGTVGLWTVDNTGAPSNLTNFGPYTGWSVTKIATGPDGLSRLLWFKGDGTQALWLLNANNSFNNGFNYGPY